MTRIRRFILAASFLLAGFLAVSCEHESGPDLPPPETPGQASDDGRPPVVFIGDSITWQWTRTGFHPEYFTANGYINKGISGNTTIQMLDRFQADVINLNPHCVVIEGGTNDLAKATDTAILARLKQMAEMALAAGIPVVLGSVPPSNSFPKVPDFKPADRIISLNALIQDYAVSKGIPYADYYSVLVDENKGLKQEYQKDSIHPNAAGYQEMEKVIQPILKKILEENAKK